MQNPMVVQGLIFLIAFLVPGFVGIIAYNMLAISRKPTNLTLIAFAMLLTIVSNVVSNQLFDRSTFPQISVADESLIFFALEQLTVGNVAVPSGVSIVLAVAVAVTVNTGWFYRVLQHCRLTTNTGRISVWHDVFADNRERWVEVQFEDGRRLIGWPRQYSADTEIRELFLAESTWFIPAEDGDWQGVSVDGPGTYIFVGDQVVAVNVLTGKGSR